MQEQTKSTDTDDRSQNPGCLGFLLQLFFGRVEDSSESDLPFRLRDDFLSPAELSFYHAVQKVIPESFVVLTKVNLGDLFYVSATERKQSYRNKIDRKHVDFLICDRSTMRPSLGIELDDASHRRADRIEQDQLVDRVFAAVGLPLLRQAAQKGYQLEALRLEIHKMLAGESEVQPASSQQVLAPDASPVCPKCQLAMVLRVAKKGPRTGQKFYGCTNYPRCQGVILADPNL